MKIHSNYITLLVSLFVSLSTVVRADENVTIALGSAAPGCEETDICFLPHTISINEGESVVWSNQDTAAHTVTSGTPGSGPDGFFDSGLFLSGETFLFNFNSFAPGVYPYYCMVHPWMEGVIQVASPPDPPITLNFSVERSPDLTSNSWEAVSNAIITVSNQADNLFYRLRINRP